MKTRTHISTLLLVAAILFTSNIFANNTRFDFEEEAYIDDIPFNTSNIAANHNYNLATAETFELAEEEYIHDIPFNTSLIAYEAVNAPIIFQDEVYIDDIPFDTQEIAVTAIFNQAFNTVFEMSEEAFVDDIPFDTSLIACSTEPGAYCVAMK